MKTPWIVIRIILSLGAIFAIGMWVGRVTAPQVEEEELAITDGPVMDEEALRYATQRATRRYRNELELTQEQMKIIRPMVLNVSRRIAMLPSHSKARLAVIEDFHDGMRPHLTEEQKAKATKILEGAIARERK